MTNIPCPKSGVVIFDLDGTLIDTSEDLAFSVNCLREQQGLTPLHKREVLKAVGQGVAVLIQRALEIDDANQTRTDQLIHAFRAHYTAHQGERSKPYPGILNALRPLASRYDLFVLSNKPHGATKREIDIHGLTPYFRDIFGAGAFDALKPNPVGVAAALAQSGMDNTRGIMVGDLWVDIETGHNAGVYTVFAEWGFGTLDDTTLSPTRTVSQPSDLVLAIDALLMKE
jgi:phosphoglycolate phosphatase